MATEKLNSCGSFENPVALEIREESAQLREKCVNILEAHGVLEKSTGVIGVFHRMESLYWELWHLPTSSWPEMGFKRRERLARRIYRMQIKNEDRNEEIAIMSLGEAPPRDANSLLIDPGHPHPYLNGSRCLAYLDIGKKGPTLRLGNCGKRDGINTTWKSIDVNMSVLAKYSKIIDIVRNNIPNQAHF